MIIVIIKFGQIMGCCEDKQIQNEQQFQRMMTPSTLMRAFPNELKQTKEAARLKSTISKYQVNEPPPIPTEHTSADFKSMINDLIAQGSFSREDYMRIPRQSASQIAPKVTNPKSEIDPIPYPKQLNCGSLWTIPQQNSSLNNTFLFSNKFAPNSGIQSQGYRSSISRIL